MATTDGGFASDEMLPPDDRPRRSGDLEADSRSLLVALGPLVVEDGSVNHRVVLRDLGDQYAVHTWGFAPEGRYYNNGDYFSKRGGEDDALRRAWSCFVKRCEAKLGGEAGRQDGGEPRPFPGPDAPISKAARSLREHLDPHHHWITSVGVTADSIVVYLKFKGDRRNDRIPSEWEGFPVEATYMGRIAPLGGDDH